MLRAVVFDLGGTLIDYQGGGPTFQLGDFLARTCAAYSIRLSPDLMAEGLRRYAGTIQAGSRPLDGGPELLRQLKGRGLKLGLVSNTMWPGWMHRADMRRFGLDGYFDYLLFSGESGLWKPQPATFEHVLDQLDVTAAESVFIGDNPSVDVAPAQRVGMRGVWIESPGVSLDGVQPDATIHGLAELPAVLARWERPATRSQ
jgi:putative hydrolase of the HAD superfamily